MVKQPVVVENQPFDPISVEEKLIYKKFIKLTNEDPRYLRPDRWRELLRVIKKYDLKSVIEFGAGVSTLLFSNAGLRVTCYETDAAYMEIVRDVAPKSVVFRVWNNRDYLLDPDEKFDIGLVDGILPRNRQAEIAIATCKFVALDDSVRDIKRSLWALLSPYPRVDLETTIISIFKIV